MNATDFEALVRDTVHEAAGRADTRTVVVDRVLANLHTDGTVTPARHRRWIAPVLAAAVIAVLAVGIAVAAVHRHHAGPPAIGPAAPTSTVPTAPAPTSSAPNSFSATSSPPPAGAESLCRTSQLRLTFGGGAGAAGTSYSTYYLVNDGTSACTVTGFPGVAALDATGAVVQQPAVRVSTLGNVQPVTVTTVRIPPGGRAQFVVTSTDTLPNPDCTTFFHGTDLQVYPPDETTALHLSGGFNFCDLRVGPVQAVGATSTQATSADVTTILGLVRSHMQTSDGWRVTIAPAKRDNSGQFVAIPGRATQTYLIPSAMVPDNGVTLVGPIELTLAGSRVTALTIVGG